MSLQVLIFILLFGLLQGLLVFGILLCRKNVRPFHIFLSAYIVVLLFQIGLKVISKIWMMEVWLPGYLLSYYLPFLYGPLVYFIAWSSIAGYKFQVKELFHFLPFFLFIIFFAFFNQNRPLPGFIAYMMSPIIMLILQLVSIMAYHIKAKKLLDNFEKKALHMPAPLHISFMQKFVRISLLATCLIAGVICLMYYLYPGYQYLKWSFILLTGFIYWVSLTAFQKPGSFEVVFGKLGSGAPFDTLKAKLTILHPEIKYVNSGLKDEQVSCIIKSLQDCMDTKQLFLDAAITIDKLADLLSCHKHHLSQVLNDKLGVSFNEYINQKRIEASKQMLSNPAHDHFTIASIAYDSGFNSLSTFNDVFKKTTGVTPSQYRKMNLNESRQQRI
jgi:AraC-like DNA-binding protein